MNPNNHINGVQYLRGIAAIFVVVTHCNAMMAFPEYFGSELSSLFRSGSYGVQVFFVISGFIITLTSIDKNLKPLRSISEFIWNRFIRIIPLMWICIIGYNILSFIGTGTMEWLPFIRAMTLWPIGELKPNVIWTLRHEALFYAIFAFTVLIGKQKFWLLLLWFISPIIWNFLIRFGVNIGEYGNNLADFIFNSANFHFGLGFLIAVAWNRWRNIQHLPTTRISILCFAATASVLLIWLTVGQPSQAVINFIFSALISSLLVILALFPIGYNRIFILIGEASYSIYLVHNATLLICLEASRKISGITSIQWQFFPLFITLAITSGVLVHIFIERPLLRKARQIRRSPKVAPA